MTGTQHIEGAGVRDAAEGDVPALITIKGAGSAALHHDRLVDARRGDLHYLVLVVDSEPIGHACLVLRRPGSWSDAGDTRHLPQIVDLRIQESRRGHGYGSTFVGLIERIAARLDYRELYLSVEPVHNPRAYALYRRLGYRQLQAEPYRSSWSFEDSAGAVHSGEVWIVDMVKPLSGPNLAT